jgi:hypothetical protein
LGAAIGMLIITVIYGFVLIPITLDNQFHYDCVHMAHGSVDKSASNICEKNGKILFRE